MPGDLHHELYEYLVNHLNDMPLAQRPRSAWVMNQEWHDEVMALAGWTRQPMPVVPTTLFGRPFFVTEDGGVPHLIAD